MSTFARELTHSGAGRFPAETANDAYLLTFGGALNERANDVVIDSTGAIIAYESAFTAGSVDVPAPQNAAQTGRRRSAVDPLVRWPGQQEALTLLETVAVDAFQIRVGVTYEGELDVLDQSAPMSNGRDVVALQIEE